MIIYLATREEFLKHVREQRIEEEVREPYIAMTGHKVAANEFRAWQNSLQCVGNVLQFDEIPPELGVAIEYRIHNTAKRIDLLLSGRNAADAPAAVIVELKQWESVEPTELDGVLAIGLGALPCGPHQQSAHHTAAAARSASWCSTRIPPPGFCEAVGIEAYGHDRITTMGHCAKPLKMLRLIPAEDARAMARHL